MPESYWQDFRECQKAIGRTIESVRKLLAGLSRVSESYWQDYRECQKAIGRTIESVRKLLAGLSRVSGSLSTRPDCEAHQ